MTHELSNRLGDKMLALKDSFKRLGEALAEATGAFRRLSALEKFLRRFEK